MFTSTICSGLDNSCYSMNTTIMLKLSYFCSVQDVSFIIQALFSDKSPFELIIGLQSIRELHLFRVFPEYVGLEPVSLQSSIVTNQSQVLP